MAVTKKVSAHEIGEALAEIVKHEPLVKELWVSTHPEIHVWLVVEPLDIDAQRQLYYLPDPVYERLPGAQFEFHILNPCNHNGDVHQALPTWAEQIPLRAN